MPPEARAANYRNNEALLIIEHNGAICLVMNVGYDGDKCHLFSLAEDER